MINTALTLTDCLDCEYFVSFAEDYHDDTEPHDQGFCRNDQSSFHGNCGAGAGVICEYFYKKSIQVIK